MRSNCTLVGGDSGGPLFDLDGNVVGIHSRIGLTLSQNIHVPTELFKDQWDKLVAGEVFGQVAKKPAATAFLGVVFSEDEEDDAWVTEEVESDTPAGKARPEGRRHDHEVQWRRRQDASRSCANSSRRRNPATRSR